ncbi:hydrolase [Oceanicella sp. SM1341]|uniref:hydrolase n=1 Tax=Oceanicella sp. SM1341 TaxID=1548889 RepID=UPI000E522617|nr:hydrolase [Oceanicella sp. SM1341]
MTRLLPAAAALVLIDLQEGILSMPLAPRSGSEVLAAARPVAERFRAAGAPVVLVRVGWAADFADAPPQAVDQPLPRPEGGLPEGWGRLAPGLERPGDLVITKRHWGAFHGTELDLQLRRRGVRSIVLGGIATNFGVESTARAAWEHGYDVVLAEDLCTSVSAELHEMSLRAVMPRISRVRLSGDILLAAE